VAWAEALTRLAPEDERQHRLRSEVELFARELEDSSASRDGNESASPSTTPEVLTFPADLTSKERRVVHAMAEKYGLHSYSTGDGSHRCVSITRTGMSGMSPANKRGDNSMSKKAQFRNGTRSGECFDFRKNGTCRFGDNCKYSHKL